MARIKCDKDTIKAYLPETKEYRYDVYIRYLTNEMAIKVRDENGMGLRLLTIDEETNKVTVNNEKAFDDDSMHRYAWEYFEANFPPWIRPLAALTLFNFVDMVIHK